jgi:hypothetical protein
MKRECGKCIHITTPKRRVQCYTLTNAIKNISPFYPENVIPVMDKLAENCKRYKEKEQTINFYKIPLKNEILELQGD